MHNDSGAYDNRYLGTARVQTRLLAIALVIWSAGCRGGDALVASVDGSVNEYNTLLEAERNGIKTFVESKDFTEGDRKELAEKLDRMKALIETHPGMFTDLVEQSRLVLETKEWLESTSIKEFTADAKAITETGIRVEEGWMYRVDALDGDWSASSDTSRWPLQSGRGYPKVNLYKTCSGVAMGALIASAQDGMCVANGDWVQHQGAPNVVRIQMNDTDRSNNVGKLRVRVVVSRQWPKLPAATNENSSAGRK